MKNIDYSPLSARASIGKGNVAEVLYPVECKIVSVVIVMRAVDSGAAQINNILALELEVNVL